MSIFHSEESFVISLIIDCYKTKDIDLIKVKAKEDLSTELSKAQIYDYIHHSENYEIKTTSISMREHFKEYNEC
jgi:hypothetical protein